MFLLFPTPKNYCKDQGLGRVTVSGHAYLIFFRQDEGLQVAERLPLKPVLTSSIRGSKGHVSSWFVEDVKADYAMLRVHEMCEVENIQSTYPKDGRLFTHPARYGILVTYVDTNIRVRPSVHACTHACIRSGQQVEPACPNVASIGGHLPSVIST